jgi:hypothetical protein
MYIHVQRAETHKLHPVSQKHRYVSNFRYAHFTLQLNQHIGIKTTKANM